MEFADLEKLIKGRRSIREWQDKTVSKELLLKAIELATCAPNAGNQQNWRFYVILNKSTIQSMARATQNIADQIALWTEGTNEQAQGARWRKVAAFFKNAPAVICVGTSQYHSSVDKILAAKGETDAKAGQIRSWRSVADSRVQSVGAVVSHLLLIFHQMGLGAVWMTGPIQAKGELEKILHIPPEIDLITLIPVGYPAERPEPKPRKPVAEVCEIIE